MMSANSEPKEDPYQLEAIIMAVLARVGLDDAPAACPAGNPLFCRLHHYRDAQILVYMRNPGGLWSGQHPPKGPTPSSLWFFPQMER